MAQELREISIPEALVSINQMQQAQKSGDNLSFILGLKQLELQAERFEWDKKQDAIANLEKFNTQRSAVEKEMYQRSLDQEIRKAFDEGDMDRVRMLQSLAGYTLSPGAKPGALESDLGVIGRDPNLTDEQKQAARLERYGIRDTPKATTPGTLQKDIEFIESLKDKLTPEQYDDAIEAALGIGTKPTSPSATQEKVALVDQMVADGSITPQRGVELKQRIAAGADPSTKTDSGSLINRLEKYPAFGANRQALDRLTTLAGKDKGQKIGASLDSMLAGRMFQDIPDDQKQIIASTMAYIALADPPGGDITKRFNFAQNLLKGNIPQILEKYNAVKGKLGKLKQVQEGVYRFTGQTTDPDVAVFQAALERLVSDYVVLRSGAQITDREFERYLSTLPSVGNESEVNDAMMNAMVSSLDTYFTQYFNSALGEQWGKIATDVTMGESRTLIPQTQTQPQTGNALNPHHAHDP